jgi:hypothetical protein
MDATHNLRKAKTPRFIPKDHLGYRRALGESPGCALQRFGVTQRGGSRYESARRTIPQLVRMLMVLYASVILNDEELKVVAGAKPKRGRARTPGQLSRADGPGVRSTGEVRLHYWICIASHLHFLTITRIHSARRTVLSLRKRASTAAYLQD